jgi:hypothetical protein
VNVTVIPPTVDHGFIVSWAAQGTGAAGFNVHIGKQSRNYDQTIDAKTDTSIDLFFLDGVSTYYIAVSAYDLWNNEDGYSPEVMVIMNVPPTVPSLIAPAVNSENQSVNTNLAWQSSDPDFGNTITYDVYLGSTLPLTDRISEGQIQSSYLTSGLEYNQTYYWKIIARDNKGAQAAGPVWQFKTFAANDDVDGDGLTNQQEIEAGSDPFSHDGNIVIVDGVSDEWDAIPENNLFTNYIDLEADSLCGGDADIKGVMTAVDDQYAYIMVETYSSPINTDSVLEINLDFKPGQHTTGSTGVDLTANITRDTFTAWNDIDLDGNNEVYPIGGVEITWGDVAEIKIPLSELENTSYLYALFVNVWDYNYPIDDPPTGCDASDVYFPSGNMLTFDGSDDYAWAPHSQSLDISGDQLTMEAWVNLHGETGNHWIISKQNIDANRSYGFYVNSSSRQVVPSIHADWHFESDVGNAVLEYGNWYHLAVVYDGSKIRTYVNGELNGEVGLTGELAHNLKEITIGGTYWNPTDTTNGSIDEVRIWNVARTQEQILSAMRKPLSGGEPGLIGYWQFETMVDLGVGNDDEIDDFADLSNNNNPVDLRVADPSITDSDNDGLLDEIEANACTDTNDADSDDDGIPDGVEDANQDGVFDAGETDPCDADTDGDGLQDGTESGITLANIGPDTDTGVFIFDADSASTTDPNNVDSDEDLVPDGVEDINRNGRVDEWEPDPTQKTIDVEPDMDDDGDVDGKDLAAFASFFDPITDQDKLATVAAYLGYTDFPVDLDGDGILDDGDFSGSVGDNPCV